MNRAHAETTHPLDPARPWCPGCGYDLRATVTIAGARCPECGADLQFDGLRFPGQRSRGVQAAAGFVRRTRRRVRRPAWRHLLVLPLALPVVFAALLTERWEPFVFLAGVVAIVEVMTRRPAAADSM